MTSDMENDDLPSLCPLTRCILEKDTDALKRIIHERTMNPTTLQADSKGWTALHVAAINDEYADCLKLLLSNKDTLGLNLDAEIDSGETAFFLACAEGCLKNCRIFMGTRCHPEKRDLRGYTPLHIASVHGHANVVSQLIAHCLKPNCQDTFEKSTPLHFASLAGNLDVVRVLLANKRTNLNIRNIRGELPLHAACQNGSLEIVRILVEADRRLMNGGYDLDDALMKAINYDHVECVKYLLDQGANANWCTSGHESILHHAVSTGVRKIVESVLQEIDPKFVSQQFMLRIQSFLTTDRGPVHSWLTKSILSDSSECMLPLLESVLPKGVLETPYIDDGRYYCNRYERPPRDFRNVYSPISYLFLVAKFSKCTRDKVDELLGLLLQHNITHLYKFSQMVELKGVRTQTFRYGHPFTYIFEGPWSPMQHDHYLNTLLEYGITTDYSLQCDVHYDSLFQDFDVNVLERFYRPVVVALEKDYAGFIEFLLVNSAILEPFHLWNFLQYQHLRPVTIQKENPQNVINYLIDLGVTVDTSNLSLYPFGGTIKCPKLQQLCRHAIRKHLRDVTIQDNLKNFKQKINALPLPNSLKNYLNFKIS